MCLLYLALLSALTLNEGTRIKKTDWMRNDWKSWCRKGEWMKEKETMSVYGRHSTCSGLWEWERQSILGSTWLPHHPPNCPGLWLLYAPCNLIRTACLKRTHRSLCSHHSLNKINALIADGQGHSTQHSTSGLRVCHWKVPFSHNNISIKVWLEMTQLFKQSHYLCIWTSGGW